MTADRLAELEREFAATTSCGYCLGMGFFLVDTGEERCAYCRNGRVPRHPGAVELLAAYRDLATENARLRDQLRRAGALLTRTLHGPPNDAP